MNRPEAEDRFVDVDITLRDQITYDQKVVALSRLLDMLWWLGVESASDRVLQWASTNSELGGSPRSGYIDPYVQRRFK